MSFIVTILFLVLFGFGSALAQDTETPKDIEGTLLEVEESSIKVESEKHIVRFDIIPLIIGLADNGHGLGIEYEYNVYKKIGLGMKAFYRIDNEKDPKYFDKWEILDYNIGVYFSYYLNSFGDGFFAALGFEHGKAIGEAKGTLAVVGGKVTVEDKTTQSGVGVMLGYSYMSGIKLFKDSTTLNGTISTTYRPLHTRSTEETNVGTFEILEPKYGLGLSLSIDLQF